MVAMVTIQPNGGCHGNGNDGDAHPPDGVPWQPGGGFEVVIMVTGGGGFGVGDLGSLPWLQHHPMGVAMVTMGAIDGCHGYSITQWGLPWLLWALLMVTMVTVQPNGGCHGYYGLY